jgi:hypothetical protein
MGSAEATVGQVERRRKTRRPEALGSPASWFQQSDELRGVWPQKREEQMAQEPENPKARAKGATRGLGRKDASRSEGETVSGARGEGTLESWFSDDLKSWGGPEAWPESDASGVYTISITWRPLPGYETEAGAPAMEEKALSRSVSAKRASAILRMLEEDADDEPIGGGI